MTYTLHKSQVYSIRQGEPDFKIIDGFSVYPRAMVHILPECPWQVRDQINFAIAKGYLQLVANVTERERIFMGLTNDS
jgi:hypothetical protein